MLILGESDHASNLQFSVVVYQNSRLPIYKESQSNCPYDGAHLRPFLRIDAYGADATSICSDTFFLVGNANVCPLAPDRTFSNIAFSTHATIMTMSVTTGKEQHRTLVGFRRVALFVLIWIVSVQACDKETSNGHFEATITDGRNNPAGHCLIARAADSDTVKDELDDPEPTQDDSSIPWYRQIAECADHHAKCQQWADKNECALLSERTLKLCPAACNICDNDNKTNTVNNCYGEAQLIPSNVNNEARFRLRLEKIEDYMLQHTFVDPKYFSIRGECKNRDKDCTYWAVTGECETNSKYMTLMCSPACFTCDMLDFTVRCPFDPNEPGVWGPGDLNRMFERITTHESYDKYNATVLSSPKSVVSSPTGGLNSTRPWVITLENFLSAEECERIIELGHERGYERSGSVGEKRFDGTYTENLDSVRTSMTTWCKDDCSKDPAVMTVHERIAELGGIETGNSEYLQLLRYEQGQYYKVHHDFIPYHLKRAQGVRILTIFLYLNDVEGGGGTHFSALNLTVQPKQGRAVVWPSVLDEVPNMQDDLMLHEALPVQAGIKYSANSWIHQRNFKLPFHQDCH